jgi:hypothetical protein
LFDEAEAIGEAIASADAPASLRQMFSKSSLEVEIGLHLPRSGLVDPSRVRY